MVDMSATLIHHGHIRLLRRAAEHGSVIVALTVDSQIESVKGYRPELSYPEREEILLSIRYVFEVVPCDWLITESFMDRHRCRLLVHGDDNANAIPTERLLVLPRTEGISSSDLRLRAMENVIDLERRRKDT